MTARQGWLWLGRRGWVLLLIGVLWIITAWSVHQFPYPNWRPRALHEYLPRIVREGLWVLTGLVAIWSAFLRRPGADRWGYFALIVMPAERVLSWFLSGLIYLGGWLPMPTVWLCIANMLVWLVVGLLLMIMAGWREDPVVVKVPAGVQP